MVTTWVRGGALNRIPPAQRGSGPPLRSRGGIQLKLRPLAADDGDRLCRLFGMLSPESVYRRFLSPMPRPRPDLLPRLLDVDHCNREAIVALEGDDIIAVARYLRAPGSDVAEISLVVADEWQRRGLGRLLMGRLARLARRRGVRAFVGTIAGENRAALLLARSAAPGVSARWATGEVEFEIPLSGTPPAQRGSGPSLRSRGGIQLSRPAGSGSR